MKLAPNRTRHRTDRTSPSPSGGNRMNLALDRLTHAPRGGTRMKPRLLPKHSSGQPILLPFTSQAISRRAFEAAIRLAHAEGATIVPAFLARVPRNLPIE